jgi:hypothetical protein
MGFCRCATNLADSWELVVRIWRFRLEQGAAGLVAPIVEMGYALT